MSRTISRGRPSYHQGFARSAGESAYPGLWKDLRGAWIPSLGPTGTTLRDVSGYGAHGTLTNMDPSDDWRISERGYILNYDGSTNEHVLIGNPAHLQITGHITVQAWVRFTSDNANTGVVSKWGTTTNRNFRLIFSLTESNSGAFTVQSGNNTFSALNTTTNYNDGEWHLMTGRWNGANVLFDMDAGTGDSVVGDALTAALDNNTIEVQIGKYNAFEFIGDIGPVFIWARSITNNEMLTEYVHPVAPFILRPRVVGFVAAGIGTDYVGPIWQQEDSGGFVGRVVI